MTWISYLIVGFTYIFGMIVNILLKFLRSPCCGIESCSFSMHYISVTQWHWWHKTINSLAKKFSIQCLELCFLRCTVLRPLFFFNGGISYWHYILHIIPSIYSTHLHEDNLFVIASPLLAYMCFILPVRKS